MSMFEPSVVVAAIEKSIREEQQMQYKVTLEASGEVTKGPGVAQQQETGETDEKQDTWHSQ